MAREHKYTPDEDEQARLQQELADEQQLSEPQILAFLARPEMAAWFGIEVGA